MKIRTIAAAALAAPLLAAGVLAPAGSASAQTPTGKDGAKGGDGQRSLAAVLTSDGNRFDRRGGDYDIVTEAVLAVVGAKPDSPVAVLADGSTPVTAFLPNDWSFKRFVKDVTGRWYRSEKRAFDAIVAAAGVDTIEQVLLYHVVPGATLTSSDALGVDGASLTTAQGGAIEVDVKSRWFRVVRLHDADPDDRDPYLNPFALDINKGNRQIAHGILGVLRPIDL
ncbi:fasciclin domain-containing protein [Mumia flava]|uniref:Fasciclin domain-containing protein n=1 Tax=Mumia flava TaxID=1348852 RepID=A0A0B2BJS5_9ACTN|nr:fasciclin domain-containing protein [Mumia flava]PJJ57377.1 fasciclin domain-containing protein [Mumia flava]